MLKWSVKKCDNYLSCKPSSKEAAWRGSKHKHLPVQIQQ